MLQAVPADPVPAADPVSDAPLPDLAKDLAAVKAELAKLQAAYEQLLAEALQWKGLAQQSARIIVGIG